MTLRCLAFCQWNISSKCMSEMENIDVMHGSFVGLGMSGRHGRISDSIVYQVLQFHVCCHSFPVFVSVPVHSCMSHFVLCHICACV